MKRPISAIPCNGIYKRVFDTVKHFGTSWSPALRYNIASLLLLRQLKGLNNILAEYEQQIETLAKTQRYEKPVQALTCYKGIKNIFALTMITEIGDVKRFAHPRQLTSWIGMDIREYSSGGKYNRFGITKQGNRYLRTAFIEANQRGYRTARISKDLKARRAHSAPEFIDIADRCLSRLNRKGNRLLNAGKHPNKVKVANPPTSSYSRLQIHHMARRTPATVV